MWPMIALAAGSALLGASQAKAQRKQQEAQNMAAAAQTQYSPWTGLGAGQLNTATPQSTLEGAASGGLKGYMTAQSLGAGSGGSSPAASTPTGQPDFSAKLASETPSFGAPQQNPGSMPGMPEQDELSGYISAMKKKPTLFGQG